MQLDALGSLEISPERLKVSVIKAFIVESSGELLLILFELFEGNLLLFPMEMKQLLGK